MYLRLIVAARHSAVSQAKKSDFFTTAEWCLGVLLTVVIVILLAVRAIHAGALWRDECAVVQLSRMPSISDVVRNFQHEAFPVPFPLLIRAYTHIFGTSDAVLRALGFGVGVFVLGAVWTTACLIGYRLPLVALALFGMNATFFVWGTTIRGYGLGSALIILTFGFIVSVLIKLSLTRALICVLLAIAAVRCLVHNLVLVFALTGSAVLVCLARRDFKRVIIFPSVLLLAAVSFLPYIDRYFGGSPWSQVVEFPVTFRLLWNQLNFALGNLRLAQDDQAAAKLFYGAVLNIDSRHKGALNNLGVTALEANQFDEAEKWFRRAENIDPRNPKTPFLLAKVLLTTGSHEAAKSEIDVAIRLQPEQRESEN